MNRVIYLIALEKVFNNAIFENQVKKLLVGLKRRKGEHLELTLLVLLPWIELTRRGLYSNFKVYRRELAELREELAGAGIKLVVSRTMFPSAFFSMKMPGLFCFSLLTLPVVWYQILVRRAKIVHCRYYYATFVALLASRLSVNRVKVIFDVRSLLPEQGIVNNIWKKEDSAFKFWKRVERWMLNRADRVIAVAPAMSDLIRAQHGQVRVETIPNFVDSGVFHPDSDLRNAKRRELGLENRIVLLYSGTLGGRYPSGRMAECVKLFFASFGRDSFFLILTSSDEKRVEPLARELTASGLERGASWQAMEASAAEVPAYLNAADWSLLVIADFLTGETFLPIKFAEYLAVGLPVLTHPRNKAIAAILKKYRIGAELDAGLSIQELGDSLRRDEARMRENCVATARENFSLERFTLRYAEIYSELTQK
ncbi:MAG: glycosyltransferase family 4 protein [Candidatus Glassbacteria bacterium]|nr:glycosyltransferase family 4 protein [Candidatus Glassbacteria bacterium]